ncbi:hypothetical protein J6590_029744 [Homalodisca vitripennis]|nr:hypothetical protein J6590_029744 [Homalodisca vitripennis]
MCDCDFRTRDSCSGLAFCSVTMNARTGLQAAFGDSDLKLSVDKYTVLYVIPHSVVHALTDKGNGIAFDDECLAVFDFKILSILLDRSILFSH